MLKFILLPLLTAFCVQAQAYTNFYHEARMPRGPAIGKLLDTSRVRPVLFLDATEYRHFNTSPRTHYLVGNIYHQGRFHIAMIPRRGVNLVSYLRVKFAFASYHSMARLRLADNTPILLVAPIPTHEQQEHGEMPAPYAEPLRLNDILISIEAAFVPGQSFDLLKGLKDEFAVAYRLISAEERFRQYYQEGAAGAWRPIEQYQTNYTGAEGDEILHTAVAESQRAGLSRTYNTILRQCTTLLFQIFEKAAPYLERERNPVLRVWDVFWNKVGFLDPIVPALSPVGLRLRGVISRFFTFDGQNIRWLGRLSNLEAEADLQDELTAGLAEYLDESADRDILPVHRPACKAALVH